MKTRAGFVSNSSTSSFVLVGFYVDAATFTKEGLTKQLDCGHRGKNKDLEVYESDYYGMEDGDDAAPVPEGKLLVGIKVTDIEYKGNDVVSIGETIPKLTALQATLGLTGEDHPLVLFHHLTNQ